MAFIPKPLPPIPGLQYDDSLLTTLSLADRALARLDGNGRLGRLLITLFLCEQEVLHKPLLYLSLYLRRHQNQYYQLLNEIRYDGAWEAWCQFFLQGIKEISDEALTTAQEIISLKENVTGRLFTVGKASLLAFRLADHLFQSPVITVPQVQEALKTNRQTAYDLIHTFEDLGIIIEMTGKKRYKKYLFSEYIKIIEKGCDWEGEIARLN